MCFSATASFVTTGVLSATGAAAVRETGKSSRVLLAAIPLLFAVHQLAEGVVWLTLRNLAHAAWQRPAMFSYLVVAKVVWPLWVPLSVFAAERTVAYRKALLPFLALGAVSSLYQAYLLIVYPVSASVAAHHIHYEVASPPSTRWLSGILYFVPTVFPLFLCSLTPMRLVGLGVLGSFIFSAIYFREALGSVWCFFAALISLLILFAVRAPRQVAQPAPASH
jgi:uncharacterized protein DUF6629